MKKTLLALSLVIAGCVQLPPTPADIQAKRFEPTPGKAVLYVVRPPVDSGNAGHLVVDSGESISTMGGTYNRVEVSPGVRYIDSSYPLGPRLTLNAEPGRIYFLRHTVYGTRFPSHAFLQQVSEQQGRELVAKATLFP